MCVCVCVCVCVCAVLRVSGRRSCRQSEPESPPLVCIALQQKGEFATRLRKYATQPAPLPGSRDGPTIPCSPSQPSPAARALPGGVWRACVLPLLAGSVFMMSMLKRLLRGNVVRHRTPGQRITERRAVARHRCCADALAPVSPLRTPRRATNKHMRCCWRPAWRTAKWQWCAVCVRYVWHVCCV